MTESRIEFCQVVGDNCFINAEKYAGGISGYTNNNSNINNCTNLANVYATDYLGGITGIAFYGTKLQNVTNLAKNIVGKKYVGGISGYSEAEISYSSNHTLDNKEGIIVGDEFVGGIAGINYKMGNITDCYNSSKIVVNSANGGGITGINNSNISNCYNVGEISTNGNTVNVLGGICGQNSSESYIYTSYNVGKIDSKDDAAGLVYANFGQVQNGFYLDSSLEKEGVDSEFAKTEDDMKNAVLTDLGEYFAKDEANINSGFPILTWQSNASSSQEEVTE